MGLEISSNQLPKVGVQSNGIMNVLQNYLASQKTVTPTIKSDYININTDLYKYINENAISEMIKVNAEIKRIMEEFKLPIKINMNILHDLIKNHLPQTKKATVGITNNLPKEFKSKVNLKALQKASILHDCGKALIPEHIINKQGKLTPKEREIMEKHAILSYEILKNTDLDEETLNLIRNHHQNAQKTGYPEVDDHFVADINLQILLTADIYSALREKRPYKPKLTKNQALTILHKDMKQGKIHPYVFKALVDYANKEDNLIELDSQWQVSHLKSVNSLSA